MSTGRKVAVIQALRRVSVRPSSRSAALGNNSMPQAGGARSHRFTTLLFKSPRSISFPEAFGADIDI